MKILLVQHFWKIWILSMLSLLGYFAFQIEFSNLFYYRIILRDMKIIHNLKKLENYSQVVNRSATDNSPYLWDNSNSWLRPLTLLLLSNFSEAFPFTSKNVRCKTKRKVKLLHNSRMHERVKAKWVLLLIV